MDLNLPGRHTIDHSEDSYNGDTKDKRRIRKLGDLFKILGKDPAQNIHSIVRQACEVLDCACSLYNRLDEKNAGLVCWADYNLPPGFPTRSPLEGQICFEATIQGKHLPVILEDLTKTPFGQSDPNVKQFGLQAYLGYPIRCNHHVIGSLAVMDTQARQFDDTDIYLISTLAKALSLEEERLRTGAALNQSENELSLQKAERRYRDLYNNTPVMLCSMDRDNRITSASNLWLETLGYTRDEVIGRNLLDFFTPESQRDAAEITLPEFYRCGQMKNQFFEWKAKAGQKKNILLSAIAQKDEHGMYDGSLAFAIDVTVVKKTEMERNRLSARLQQAQKMEAIATLAGGIAHQFNNALAVILGNLELIHMDGMYDTKLTVYAEPINQAAQKMVQLTGQLLAYARGGKFQTQSISAHRFVTETLRIVQHSMAPYVNVETDLSPNTDHIEVDLTQMQMLLAAILANASEAMENEGQVRIALQNAQIGEPECRNHPGLKPGRWVLLRITDNGKGMDAQTCERIFEPFFTTKFQGRGLGMAAVYGIVKKHGGYAYVDSILGQGTTVSIYLPGITSKQAVAEPAEPYIPTRTGTALIVEDEHLVMEVNRAIVEKLGYQVLEAKTGKEALAMARKYEGKIDFALLDVILPDMDGSLIYPELKAARPDMKVVVCSGFALDGPAREMLEAGAESYIQKPFTVAALSAVLQKIFKNTEYR